MLHQAGITSDQLDCMRHAQQQAGISAAVPTVSGAKHARIAEDDADAARRCRDLAMLIIMDQRTLQDLSARANQDFLTDRARTETENRLYDSWSEIAQIHRVHKSEMTLPRSVSEMIARMHKVKI